MNKTFILFASLMIVQLQAMEQLVATATGAISFIYTITAWQEMNTLRDKTAIYNKLVDVARRGSKGEKVPDCMFWIGDRVYGAQRIEKGAFEGKLAIYVGRFSDQNPAKVIYKHAMPAERFLIYDQIRETFAQISPSAKQPLIIQDEQECLDMLEELAPGTTQPRIKQYKKRALGGCLVTTLFIGWMLYTAYTSCYHFTMSNAELAVLNGYNQEL